MPPDHQVLLTSCSSWKRLAARERILNASHVSAFGSITEIVHREEWQTKNIPLLAVGWEIITASSWAR